MQKYEQNLTANSSGALRPLSGASVTVTDNANGLPAALYSDNGVTPLPQPLTTDGTGYFGFYAADGRYTLTFSGPRFSTFTREILLEDPADNPAVTLQELGLPSAADKIGYGSRTVSDKLGEVISVKDKGAKDDGTDATAAFVAVSGLSARIPEGEFVLLGDVALNLDTKLVGAGRNSTILHVHGELSWNSTGDMQTGGFSDLTIVYHGGAKARIVGVNMEFDNFTQNAFLAQRFSVRPASTSDKALVFFDVVDPRQAVFRDFYVDGNYAAANNPVGQAQETVFKTSGTGFGFYADGYFARDVYRFAYQTGAVEGGHIGCGEVVGCYIGIESDAAVPGGWVSGAHINAVHRAIKYTNRSHCWVDGLSAFRAPSFHAADWAAVELNNCVIVNVQTLQGICNPASHTSRASGIIANGCTGLIVNGAQTVEVGRNGGAFLELIGTTGVDARACIGAACDVALSADVSTSKVRADIFARTGAGTVNSAGTQVYVKDIAPAPTISPWGTAAAPGVSFVGELDCGLFVPVANNVGVAAGGGEVARFVPSGTANRVEFVSGGTGVAPRVRARGTDTDIDLELGTAGGGSLKAGYGSLAAATPGAFSAARYLRFKDSSGTTYYLPLATAPW